MPCKSDPEDGGDMFLQEVGQHHITTRHYMPEERTLHLKTEDSINSCRYDLKL
jgi:hypothetical protein